jgi:hypothetical protein
MLGDSLVQFWPKSAAERAFPGRRALNAAVAGDGAAALLHRLDQRRTEATVEGRRLTLGVAGWEQQNPTWQRSCLARTTYDVGRPATEAGRGGAHPQLQIPAGCGVRAADGQHALVEKVFFSGSRFSDHRRDLVAAVSPAFLRNPGSAL